jgi:hypothetical protein
MSHKHDHEDHGHHHQHGHEHGHDHAYDQENPPGLTFHEKMEKMLSHWIKHNRDHEDTYRKWVAKASEEGMNDVGQLIEAAAAISEKMDHALKEALQALRQKV